MSKRILSLDLGITSIGYCILEELSLDRYSLIDYGVSMFDKPTNKDNKSKKLLHSATKSASKLIKLRKRRLKKLALLFESYGLGDSKSLLEKEHKNFYPNKWYLRAKKVFEEKLSVQELFSILYLIAKHRGYKSLDSDDLLEELYKELNLDYKQNKQLKDEEKGKIKNALKKVEELRVKYPQKSVASIIYEIEINKSTPTFRNHDNYNYMIKREYIKDEIEKIILAQAKLGALSNIEVEKFIKDIIEIIDDQKDATNDLSLFGNCQYYSKYKVAPQYSLLSDIFNMYQSVSNITFNKEKRAITKEEIKKVEEFFYKKIEKGKSFSEITFKDIREILDLDKSIRIFNKEDFYFQKGKKVYERIAKFNFLPSLSKIDNKFIKTILKQDNYLDILDEIFTILQQEKAPKSAYKKLEKIFKAYKLVEDEDRYKKIIISLIKEKNGRSLHISHYAMKQFIPYFQEGLNTQTIKETLNLITTEDYSKYKKGIKYLTLKQYEEDENLEINNHSVKYVVSAVLRLIKHLHTLYGTFDEIRVESTRELSLNEEAKRNIEKANKEQEKKFKEILENKEYQEIAKTYNKSLKKYAKKIMMWEEQKGLDIYSGKTIGFDDIFANRVDIDHIIPQSLGGLSVKHNLILAHRDENIKKSNRLPLDFVENKIDFIKRVEYLFSEHKINWKKRKNLLANNLEETYKDTFESKSLRATSYIEALTAKVLKYYYPFKEKQKLKDGSAIRHIQGRATSNIRKLLDIQPKVRDTNIHHAIDAILIGLINHSWLQKLSNTFRENRGVIDSKAQRKIKKNIPLIEGLEPKNIIEKIEENFNIYGEDSIFYKDVFGNRKSVYYWVSKKPMVSKIHKDTIYSKRTNGIFTNRVDIQKEFINLKLKPTTPLEKFQKDFEKNILSKLYLHITNQNDAIYIAIKNRAKEIENLLRSFKTLHSKDKGQLEEAKKRLDSLIHSPIKDNNSNIIRRVKYYQKNLSGYEIRGGLATSEKSFIGFRAYKRNGKIIYDRIDLSNFNILKKENDNSFKVYKNEIIFFIFKDNSFKGGKIVSFLEDKKIASFQNPRYPSAIKFQPENFCTIGKDKNGNKKKISSKQHKIGKAIGIIKLNLDILGNIKSYQKFGEVNPQVEKILLQKE